MKLTDRIGAILVIAAKPRIQSSVRSALTAKYGRILTGDCAGSQEGGGTGKDRPDGDLQSPEG